MTDAAHASHSSESHGLHAVKKYLYVCVALLILSALSFLTYSDAFRATFQSVAARRMFMLAVSCAKAMLVVLFFMHLKYEANWKYVLTIPATFMSILLLMALVPDVGARVNGFWGAGMKYTAERRAHVADAEDARLMHEAAMNLAAHEE
jgi:cytochrome c oxidase subunit 4